MGFLDPKEGMGQGWGTLGPISPCPIVIPIKTTEWLCKVAYLGKIEKLWMDDKWGKKLGLALLTNTTKLVEQQWITKKKSHIQCTKKFPLLQDLEEVFGRWPYLQFFGGADLDSNPQHVTLGGRHLPLHQGTCHYYTNVPCIVILIFLIEKLKIHTELLNYQ